MLASYGAIYSCFTSGETTYAGLYVSDELFYFYWSVNDYMYFAKDDGKYKYETKSR